MSQIRIKLKEALGFIRQQPITQNISASVDFLTLEDWATTNASATEPGRSLLDAWKAVSNQAAMALQGEKNRLEEEKRKWGGINNPYFKKINELIERKCRDLDQKKLNQCLPITASFINELNENCLVGQSPIYQKGKYVFEKQHLEKILYIYNKEHHHYLQPEIQELYSSIQEIRKETLRAFPCIPEEQMVMVSLKYQARIEFELELEEDRYAVESRPVKKPAQILTSNLVKTLRAPTIVLMTGAFVYGILTGGSLRDVFNSIFIQYPILIVIFLLALLLYFALTSKEELQANSEDLQGEKSRSWAQISNQLRSDIKGLFNARKSDLKLLFSALREGEAEWYASVSERYVQQEIDSRIHPIGLAMKGLLNNDIEIPRLINEEQRNAAVIQPASIHNIQKN